MRIERIEIRVTDLKTRLQRPALNRSHDNGAPSALVGKPVLAKLLPKASWAWYRSPILS